MKLTIVGASIGVWLTYMTLANRSSFQDSRKANTAVVATLGRIRGSTMRRRAAARLQPSTRAANSVSGSTPSKAPTISQTTNGRMIALCPRNMPGSESTSCRLLRMPTRGTSKMIPGSM